MKSLWDENTYKTSLYLYIWHRLYLYLLFFLAFWTDYIDFWLILVWGVPHIHIYVLYIKPFVHTHCVLGITEVNCPVLREFQKKLEYI